MALSNSKCTLCKDFFTKSMNYCNDIVLYIGQFKKTILFVKIFTIDILLVIFLALAFSQLPKKFIHDAITIIDYLSRLSLLCICITAIDLCEVFIDAYTYDLMLKHLNSLSNY
jgi:hypothetical protein